MPKKSTTKKQNAQYKKMYKELRPFVDFKIDLRSDMTRGQKSMITKYYRELQRMTGDKPYSVQVYRSKNRTRLKAVQQLGGQDSRLSHFKVAFVPKNSEHQKIKFNKKGEPQIKTQHVESTFIPLDLAEHFIEGGADFIIADYVASVIESRQENSFSIQAGDYEIHSTFSKSRVGAEVAKLCSEYSNPLDNHYFGNWLGGLFANNFTDQATLDEYRNAKRAAQIKKDRSRRTRESKKTIKLFYWYDRKQQTVLLTKTDTAPNNHCEGITRREYDKFLKTGEI